MLQTWDSKNTQSYEILQRKSRCVWQDNTKLNVKGMCFEGCALGQESVNGYFVHDNEFSVSVKGRGFLTS
jgi:hypothetical protein